MVDENRQYRRIEKRLTIQFCLADVAPRKWDMSMIENISVGGVKFVATSDLKLNDKIIQLQIRIPELAPRFLELQALVLSVKPRFNGKISDVRAKFINLSDEDKKNLSVIQGLINFQEAKNTKK
jgi:hypothetical protein